MNKSSSASSQTEGRESSFSKSISNKEIKETPSVQIDKRENVSVVFHKKIIDACNSELESKVINQSLPSI